MVSSSLSSSSVPSIHSLLPDKIRRKEGSKEGSKIGSKEDRKGGWRKYKMPLEENKGFSDNPCLTNKYCFD